MRSCGYTSCSTVIYLYQDNEGGELGVDNERLCDWNPVYDRSLPQAGL